MRRDDDPPYDDMPLQYPSSQQLGCLINQQLAIQVPRGQKYRRRLGRGGSGSRGLAECQSLNTVGILG